LGCDYFLGRLFCLPAADKKPGFPLQFLANRFAVCCGISASIPGADLRGFVCETAFAGFHAEKNNRARQF
jgi:hypothetical protein